MVTKSTQRHIATNQKLFDRKAKIIRVFNLLQKISDGLYGKIHIVDASEDEDVEGYRIYHADGYCIEFTLEPEYDCDTDEWIQNHYCMYQRFDEFDKASEEFVFNELIEQLESVK